MSISGKEVVSEMPLRELRERAEEALELFQSEREARNEPVERLSVTAAIEDGAVGVIFAFPRKNDEQLYREISAKIAGDGVLFSAVVFEDTENQHNEVQRRRWRSEPWKAPLGLVREPAHFAGIIGALYTQAMMPASGDLQASEILRAERTT